MQHQFFFLPFMYDHGQTTAVHVSIIIDVSPENNRIRHLYKVVPTVILIGGRATADLPRKIFPERSREKSIKHFNEQLEDRQFCQKISSLLPH